MAGGKFMLGAREKVARDDSIPVELLPSNKIMYVARLNDAEEVDLTQPVRCNNLKEVFQKFRPRFSVELETAEGEPVNADFEVKSMKDFTSKELIEQNDHLRTTYYGKEILSDLDKQLKKNNALKKAIEDPAKKEALIKAAKHFIDLLSESE